MTNEELNRLNKLQIRTNLIQKMAVEVSGSDIYEGFGGSVKIFGLPLEIRNRLAKVCERIIAEEQAAALAVYESELSKWGQQK